MRTFLIALLQMAMLRFSFKMAAGIRHENRQQVTALLEQWIIPVGRMYFPIMVLLKTQFKMLKPNLIL